MGEIRSWAQGTCEYEGKATPLTNIAKHHLLFYLPNKLPKVTEHLQFYDKKKKKKKKQKPWNSVKETIGRVSSQSTRVTYEGQTYRKPIDGMG